MDHAKRPAERVPIAFGEPLRSPSVVKALSDAPVSSLVVQVSRFHRAMAGQLLRPLGLHPSQELVLIHLWESGPQRQIDLARQLGADAATMTRTIKRLEAGGYVRCEPSPTDGRVTMVEPTTASWALRQEVERVWQQLEQAMTDGFSPEERDQAVVILERIRAGLERVVEQGRDGTETPGSDIL